MSAPSLSSTPADTDVSPGQPVLPAQVDDSHVPWWRPVVVLGFALLTGLTYLFNPPMNV